MKQLVCEMCGGTDLVKDGGVFICQTCGCKYSVEEAKKMMVEGTVDIQGTVKIDRSNEQQQMIENYLSMCKDASDALDTDSVVEYSDKILEIDPNNYEAWIYRALASGWNSSINNMKTGQVITAAKRALTLAPEEERYDIAERIFIQGKSQIVAHLKRVFSMSGLSLSITAAAVKAAKQAELIHPVMSAWIQLVSEIPYLSSERLEAEVKDCRGVCEGHSVVMPTAYNTFNNKEPYYTTMQEKVKARIETASKEREEMFRRRREEYWTVHSEEKQALDTEKQSLQDNISNFNSQIDSLPEVIAVMEIEKQIAEKSKEKDSLGMFKGKEKKAIQSTIDELSRELQDAKTKKEEAVAPLNEAVNKCQERIAEIENELTKNR